MNVGNFVIMVKIVMEMIIIRYDYKLNLKLLLENRPSTPEHGTALPKLLKMKVSVGCIKVKIN